MARTAKRTKATRKAIARKAAHAALGKKIRAKLAEAREKAQRKAAKPRLSAKGRAAIVAGSRRRWRGYADKPLREKRKALGKGREPAKRVAK